EKLAIGRKGRYLFWNLRFPGAGEIDEIRTYSEYGIRESLSVRSPHRPGYVLPGEVSYLTEIVPRHICRPYLPIAATSREESHPLSGRRPTWASVPGSAAGKLLQSGAIGVHDEQILILLAGIKRQPLAIW